MRYHNPKIPEGINISSTHPLADFAWMLTGIALGLLALVVSAHLLAAWLVPQLPFQFEQKILRTVEPVWEIQTKLASADEKKADYLQKLANRLAQQDTLPEGLVVKVRYINTPKINAFATLGGNILIHQGLLDNLHTENGLAMVIAHELGHLVHRDPLLATGRATVSLAAIALISGFSETRVAENLFSLSAQSLLLSFSRQQERRADQYALNLLIGYYGHTAGATEFFESVETLADNTRGYNQLLEFFDTHPNRGARMDTIAATISDPTAPLVPLPDFLSSTRR